HLHELAGAINRTSSDAERSALQRALEAGGRLMGLLGQSPLEWLQGGAHVAAAVGSASGAGTALGVGASVVPARIDALIAKRATLRRQRRYIEADSIRAKLASEGIIL